MKIGRIACLCLLLASLLALFQSSPILAQDEGPVEESIELIPTHVTLEGIAGANFMFEVDLKYQGSEPRRFDLLATGPEDWIVVVTEPGQQKIFDKLLEPGRTFGQTVTVIASPPFLVIPEPREYEITLEVSSGDLRGSVALKAIITTAYHFTFVPTEGLWDTKATAGKDNYFSIVIQNTGSGTIEDIKFSSRKPTGWSIEFSPQEIDTLSAISFQTVEVTIKPDPKSIAGRYRITLAVNTTQTPEESINIWVDVETPTVWGWVGIGIILVVIAGIIAIFMRFSRR